MGVRLNSKGMWEDTWCDRNAKEWAFMVLFVVGLALLIYPLLTYSPLSPFYQATERKQSSSIVLVDAHGNTLYRVVTGTGGIVYYMTDENDRVVTMSTR